MKIILQITEYKLDNQPRKWIANIRPTAEASAASAYHVLRFPSTIEQSTDEKRIERETLRHLIAFGFAREDIDVQRRRA